MLNYSQEEVPRSLTGVSLLNNEPNPDIEGTHRQTPLSWTANGYGTRQLLIKKGADSDIKVYTGKTPQYQAANNKNERGGQDTRSDGSNSLNRIPLFSCNHI